MSELDWCKTPGCGHHRHDHATVGLPVGVEGGCCERGCRCDQFRYTLRQGQRGSEAGCYS